MLLKACLLVLLWASNIQCFYVHRAVTGFGVPPVLTSLRPCMPCQRPSSSLKRSSKWVVCGKSAKTPRWMALESYPGEDLLRDRALVSTAWLQDNLDSVTILDVRGVVEKLPAEGDFVRTVYRPCKEQFLNGHIPGAEFVDWTADIVDPQSDVPVQLSPKDLFEAAMEEKGVSNDNTIVVYDNGKMLFATRLWWALTYYGHKNVRVLDGGWKRWCAEGRDVSSETDCPLKKYADFKASVDLPSLRCEASDMREIIEKQSEACIIDARNAAQFTSRERRARRSGCIPGAANIPYKRLIDKDKGGYLSNERMMEIFKEEKLDIEELKTRKTFLYCNGGVASTAVLFALWKLGVPLSNLSNYDGSWGEWGNQEDEVLYPVARL